MMSLMWLKTDKCALTLDAKRQFYYVLFHSGAELEIRIRIGQPLGSLL